MVMTRLLNIFTGCFFAASILVVTSCTDSDTTDGAIAHQIAGQHRSAATRARRSGITIDYSFARDRARVGEPLTIVIRYGSTSEKAPMEVYYRIDPAHGITLGSGQPEKVLLKANEQGVYPEQRVVVQAQQEGRFYLQVSVGLQASKGLQMRPLSIPIQVGAREEGSVIPMTVQAEQGISLPARMD